MIQLRIENLHVSYIFECGNVPHQTPSTYACLRIVNKILCEYFDVFLYCIINIYPEYN